MDKVHRITVQDIFTEIARVMETTFPQAKVHQERIAKLIPPALSIELVQYTPRGYSQNHILKRVDLDLIYFSKEDRIDEALQVAELLTANFNLGMKAYERDQEGKIIRNEDGSIAYERFLHVLKPPDFTFVDQDLHYMLTFEYIDNFAPVYVTRDEVKTPSGEIQPREAVAVEYDTTKQTIDNIETPFVEGESEKTIEEKQREYIAEPYVYMEDLHTNLGRMTATIEL